MAAIYARVNALDRKSSHPLTIGWSSCLKISKYRRRFARGVYANYDAMWEHVAIFGTPEHVAERLESLWQTGVEKLIFFVNYGGIEHQKVLDSLELFAAKVMPLFKD
jgi:alkanesulfonate monooxygenase SsuD/methylene tetrahydromethanopterin reductase-like flavin-dependent oxidoreductase (luciferase family)